MECFLKILNAFTIKESISLQTYGMLMNLMQMGVKMELRKSLLQEDVEVCTLSLSMRRNRLVY